jgi:hypothetical protein
MVHQEFLMGTGGVFGLTSALVGESLPGSGPAVATGNALAQGPVVFYWPQSVIDEMEQRARLDASGEWMQLRVDLFRWPGVPLYLHLELLWACKGGKSPGWELGESRLCIAKLGCSQRAAFQWGGFKSAAGYVSGRRLIRQRTQQETSMTHRIGILPCERYQILSELSLLR